MGEQVEGAPVSAKPQPGEEVAHWKRCCVCCRHLRHENKSEDAPVSAKPPVPLVTERSPLEEMIRELPASEAWENKSRGTCER